MSAYLRTNIIGSDDAFGECYIMPEALDVSMIASVAGTLADG